MHMNYMVFGQCLAINPLKGATAKDVPKTNKQSHCMKVKINQKAA